MSPTLLKVLAVVGFFALAFAAYVLLYWYFLERYQDEDARMMRKGG